MVIMADSQGLPGSSARLLDCLIYPEHKESPVSLWGDCKDALVYQMVIAQANRMYFIAWNVCILERPCWILLTGKDHVTGSTFVDPAVEEQYPYETVWVFLLLLVKLASLSDDRRRRAIPRKQ